MLNLAAGCDIPDATKARDITRARKQLVNNCTAYDSIHPCVANVPKQEKNEIHATTCCGCRNRSIALIATNVATYIAWKNILVLETCKNWKALIAQYVGTLWKTYMVCPVEDTHGLCFGQDSDQQPPKHRSRAGDITASS